MKLKLLSLLFIIPFLGFSQCPTTGITLSSQADVDAFATNYPDCTEMTGILLISGADITDLTPLSNLTSLYALKIDSNPLLENLSGLDNVINFDGHDEGSLDGLAIWNNSNLLDISALANASASSLIEGITVYNNPLLSSLNGLQGFDTVYSVVINNNDSLNDLLGLNIVNSLDGLIINNNYSLSSIGSFNSFNGFIGYFDINNNFSLSDISMNSNITISNLYLNENPNLSICNVDYICNYLNSTTSDFAINNNASGCGSISEVSQACGLVPSNDDCEGAIPLTLGETTVAYNELATESTQTPSCNDVNRADVWFTLNSGSFTTVDIIAEAGYSLQLWEGDCASLTQVASACAGTSLNDIPVTTNTDYIVQVWSDGTNRRSTGLFDILVQDGTLTTQEFAFNGFTMYPNPVNNMLNFKANQNITNISIYSLLGQAVLQVSPNTLQTELDLTHLQTGIYVVKVKIGTQEVTYKVVKE